MAKVLLVDDDETLRVLMGQQLQRAGHEVILAQDGLEAVSLMEQEAFDVVVADMKMPRLDGMGLLDRVALLAPDTEFIVLTGHGSLENALEAFKRGNVFYYLLKPLEDVQELSGVVARAAERRRLRLENGRLVSDLERRVHELGEVRRKLAELAEQDVLTGLLNHRTINCRLQTLLQESSGAVISVIMMDMDGFKPFNDTYGHLIGDQVLRHIANALRQTRPPDSFMGRCGGDEFMIVLPDTDCRAAHEHAERIRRYLAAHPFLNPDGTALPVHLCFGIADTIHAGRSAVSLLAAADAALYEGKRSGGDAIHLHVIEEDRDRELRSAFDVLDSLITAIDNKDHYTRRHSEEVATYALLLTEALGLPEDTHHAVRLAGLLHDVGKIGVPDSILRKPGRLTPEEYETMKNHVTISTLIIHGLPRLSDILEAVACHHERWDGKGYPNRLRGTEIPLLGRIMIIADAFSAMTMDRPYRAGMSYEEAFAELEQGMGTQFDPNLVPIFIRAVQERLAHTPYEFRKAA